MVIEDSDGGGADVAGTTGGDSRMVRGAEDVALGMGTIEGVVGAGDMIFVGISTCGGCSSCGGSGGAGISGALGVQHRSLNDSICRE